MSCVSRVLPEGGDGSASLELDACTRCQMFWFDPGEFEGMPTSIPEQVNNPGGATTDLPAEARMALMHARMESIKSQADMGEALPDGLIDLMAGILLLPVELKDDAPGRLNIPWVTAMLLLGVALFGWGMGFLSAPGQAVAEFAFAPADPWRMGGATLLTAFFVHGGWFHLFSNLYFLGSFGDNVEDVLGMGRFLLLWLVATVVSTGVYALAGPGEATLVAGASGSVSALVVAYALFFPRAKLGILFFLKWMVRFPAWLLALVWFVVQAVGFGGEVVGGEDGGVAYMGHLAGAAVGGLAWLIWKDRMR
jgi:membrane associated rhomboid family serine protease